MTRREFVIGGVAALAGAACATSGQNTAPPQPAGPFDVTHTDAEWRKLLSPDAYEALRHEATEPPFTSALLHESRRGTFACAGCALDVFSSTTKFDSGTGWPSFWAALENAVGITTDTTLGMVREAVHCRSCGGHLGHVFDDG